jgi:hypothetical protein
MGPNVRFRGYTGKHMLAASISVFDPSATIQSEIAALPVRPYATLVKFTPITQIYLYESKPSSCR